MRLTEIKQFYRTATVDQIRDLLESQDTQGADPRILAEVIHAANHSQGWTTWQPDDLLQQVRLLAEQAHERHRSQD